MASDIKAQDRHVACKKKSLLQAYDDMKKEFHRIEGKSWASRHMTLDARFDVFASENEKAVSHQKDLSLGEAVFLGLWTIRGLCEKSISLASDVDRKMSDLFEKWEHQNKKWEDELKK